MLRLGEEQPAQGEHSGDMGDQPQRHQPAANDEIQMFHMSIVEAAHNVVMLHMLRSLSDLLVRGVFYNRNVIYSLRERRSKLLDQHRAIRDAVRVEHRRGGA